jgi:hypothetical protein
MTEHLSKKFLNLPLPDQNITTAKSDSVNTSPSLSNIFHETQPKMKQKSDEISTLGTGYAQSFIIYTVNTDKPTSVTYSK